MKALILNIGNEVLSGKILNTNSAFLGKELSKIGIIVEKIVVIADEEERLENELISFENSNCDIIITTGGLGPTHDDLTKEVLIAHLGLSSELNNDSKHLLETYFGTQMAKSNLKQAYFPKEAIILENKVGTANGAIMSKNNKIYIILVGPPYEMNPMFLDSVVPFLNNQIIDKKMSQEFIVMGGGESYFEDYLQEFYCKYPSVYIAPYASVGKIRYEITAKANDENFLLAVNNFKDLMEDYIISENNEEIEEVIVRMLIEKHLSISLAESCTGGMIASKIVNVPNASKVFNESFVTYSYESKIKYLQVNKETIEKHGAVSNKVVLEMVLGLYNQTKADVCISVSGIAGPSGGSFEKPIGLVYFAIKIGENIHLENKIFKGSRDLIRMRSTLWILYRLYTLIKKPN